MIESVIGYGTKCKNIFRIQGSVKKNSGAANPYLILISKIKDLNMKCCRTNQTTYSTDTRSQTKTP